MLVFGDIGVRGEGFGLSHGWGWDSLNWWGKVRSVQKVPLIEPCAPRRAHDRPLRRLASLP